MATLRRRPFTLSATNLLSLAKTTSKQFFALTVLLGAACLAQQPSPTTPPLDSQPTSQDAVASAIPTPEIATVTVPAGTSIALVLTHPIQSRYIQRGDAIYAQVISPIAAGNEVVIPAGVLVEGKVDKLGRNGSRGELYLQSMSITYSDGYVVPVSGPITLESDEGYALKDPGKGRIIGAFTLPAAGAGLGTLIGYALASSQGTTINTSLPPSCGVPTPGCMNNTSSFTFPPDRVKSMAIGGGIGLAAGGIASLVLVFNTHNFFLDVGAPVEMVLPHPLTLQDDEVAVANAIRDAEQHPAPEQPIAPRPRRLPLPDTGPGITPPLPPPGP
jgi:hypothetical protein